MENDTGSMRFLSLDSEKSKAVYTRLRKVIEPKMCYNNVFHVVSHYQEKFFTGEWKVAYGFVSSAHPVFCRHCFLLDGGAVIDPTVFASGNPTEGRKYYVTKVFDELEEYLDAIAGEDNMPALERFLLEQDAAAIQIAIENGLLFI